MAETATSPAVTSETGATNDVQNIYDEIEIDDMDFEDGKFYYPCPCGDKFQITLVSPPSDRQPNYNMTDRLT